LLAQPASDRSGVQLGLDHNPAADDVQSSGKAQHRGDLRPTRPEFTQLHAAQFVLDVRRHLHKPLLSSYPDPFTATSARYLPQPLVHTSPMHPRRAVPCGSGRRHHSGTIAHRTIRRHDTGAPVPEPSHGRPPPHRESVRVRVRTVHPDAAPVRIPLFRPAAEPDSAPPSSSPQYAPTPRVTPERVGAGSRW